MKSLSLNELRWLRLRAQWLYHENDYSPSEIVQRLCSIQAQEIAAGRLGIGVRGGGLRFEDVRHARETERSIVLTWCMRGTMHLISSQDFDWLMAYFGPMYIEKTARRFKELGLDAQTRLKAADAMRDILSQHEALTRPQLADHLSERGIPVAGQAIAHLVRYTALDRIICFGPEQDGELTYVLVDRWLDSQSQVDPQATLSELAKRYFVGYGPATLYDLATWAGIPIDDARTGIESVQDDLMEIDTVLGPMWMLRQYADWLDMPYSDQSVCLLPRYDAYLLGYQSRDFMVDDAYAKQVHPGGGVIRQAMISEGKAVAIWRTEKRTHHLKIVIEPFAPLDAQTLAELKAEAQRLAHFLSTDVVLEVDS